MSHESLFLLKRRVGYLRGGGGLPRPIRPLWCTYLGGLGRVLLWDHPFRLGCRILGCGTGLALVALTRARSHSVTGEHSRTRTM